MSIWKPVIAKKKRILKKDSMPLAKKRELGLVKPPRWRPARVPFTWDASSMAMIENMRREMAGEMERMTRAMIKEAKRGNVVAFRELWDRAFGKVPTYSESSTRKLTIAQILQGNKVTSTITTEDITTTQQKTDETRGLWNDEKIADVA